jgi:hypothetical protein
MALGRALTGDSSVLNHLQRLVTTLMDLANMATENVFV